MINNVMYVTKAFFIPRRSKDHILSVKLFVATILNAPSFLISLSIDS